MSEPGFYCAFEGIDGSGKTTLATRVSRELTRLGLRVQALRPEGRYRDSVAEALREVGRDPHNLRLGTVAELLVYAAREAQLMGERVLPALDRGEIVIADRSPATLLAMCSGGRGLPTAEVEAVAAVAGRGRVPDLTILLDVDLQASRLRKAVARVDLQDEDAGRDDFGRKGLSGLGLRERMGRAYRELAAAAPHRWLVLDNRRASFEELFAVAMTHIRSALQRSGVQPASWQTGASVAARSTQAPRAPVESLAALEGPETLGRAAHAESGTRARELERWFFDAVREEGEREPGLAAMLLRSLRSPEAMRLRETLAGRAPGAVALSLAWIDGDAAERLRDLLQEEAPGAVARSLRGSREKLHDLRREALIGKVPRQTLLSLGSRSDDRAIGFWEEWGDAHADLRCRSLVGRDDGEAWELRERHGRVHPEAVMVGLASVTGERSWELRDRLAQGREVWLLSSVSGVEDDRAWEVRSRLARFAPKTVALGLRGLVDPRAWELRRQWLSEAKECLDSISGLAGEDAADLRSRGIAMWPSTVVSSLGSGVHDEVSWELRWELLQRHPEDLILAKHVVRACEVWCCPAVASTDADEIYDS